MTALGRDHKDALIAIQGKTIAGLMNAMERILQLAYAQQSWNEIADTAGDAIEAAKALRG